MVRHNRKEFLHRIEIDDACFEEAEDKPIDWKRRYAARLRLEIGKLLGAVERHGRVSAEHHPDGEVDGLKHIANKLRGRRQTSNVERADKLKAIRASGLRLEGFITGGDDHFEELAFHSGEHPNTETGR